MNAIDTRIPCFPPRPVHGPRLDCPAGRSFLNPAIYGEREAEPKWNGWRLLLDRQDCIPWNRHGEILSITDEIHEAIEQVHNLPASFPRYVDCETLSRRHGLMRGSIIILDVVAEKKTYLDRKLLIADHVPVFKESDHLLERNVACATPHYPLEEALDQWKALQLFNAQTCSTGLNAFFEGLVLKLVDSVYPMQRLSPERETAFWTKHRFV